MLSRATPIKCPKCGNTGIRAYLTVNMYVNAEDAYHLTKKVIASKTTEIWATDHDRTTFTCPHCLFAWGGIYEKLKEDNNG